MDDQSSVRASRTKLSWFRSLVSCACLALSILFAVLWARSYTSIMSCLVEVGDSYYCSVNSWRGRVTLQRSNGPAHFPYATGVTLTPTEHMKKLLNKPTGVVSPPDLFFYRFGRPAWAMYCPHWFLISMLGLLAITVRPKPKFGMDLRELFLLVSLVSVGLAAIEIVVKENQSATQS